MTKKLYLTAAGSLFVLNVLDLVTTFQVFEAGGYEANPLSQWLLDYHLLIPVKLGIAGGIAVSVWRDRNKEVIPRRDLIALYTATVVYMGVVGWNLSRLVIHST